MSAAQSLPSSVSPQYQVEQRWADYAPEQHLTWERLFARRMASLISSHGDAANALGPSCERRPFSAAAVCAQPFAIDRLQDVLFVVDSFEELFGALPA